LSPAVPERARQGEEERAIEGEPTLPELEDRQAVARRMAHGRAGAGCHRLAGAAVTLVIEAALLVRLAVADLGVLRRDLARVAAEVDEVGELSIGRHRQEARTRHAEHQ